jgi:hypothetical protein
VRGNNEWRVGVLTLRCVVGCWPNNDNSWLLITTLKCFVQEVKRGAVSRRLCSCCDVAMESANNCIHFYANVMAEERKSKSNLRYQGGPRQSRKGHSKWTELKLSHYTPWRRLGEDVSSYSFLTSAPDEVSGQWHAPAALYPRGKDPRYPLYRRLGGPQNRSGHRGNRKNPFAPTGDRV